MTITSATSRAAVALFGPDRDGDVRRLERWSVVEAIADHADGEPGPLQGPHDVQLLGRGHARKNVRALRDGGQQFRGQAVERRRVENAQRLAAAEPDFLGDRLGRGGLVAGDHDRTNPGSVQALHEGLGTRHNWIFQSCRADPGQPIVR